jgi:hypothetical protein
MALLTGMSNRPKAFMDLPKVARFRLTGNVCLRGDRPAATSSDFGDDTVRASLLVE